jgi:DNA mismatch repair ATPase MutS
MRSGSHFGAFLVLLVRPEYTSDGEMRILNGRHPLLQETRQDDFVPVSPSISRERHQVTSLDC